MTIDTQRVRAVAAALKGIRNRVNEEEKCMTWSTAAYDKWVALLGDAFNEDEIELELDEEDMDREHFLMHLDAAIAFLEVYEE